MATENKKIKQSRKGTIIRLTLTAFYLLILLYLYYLLTQLGSNPIIIILLLSLVFLITIGPFFKKQKRTLYSRMFPDKKRQKSIESKRVKNENTLEREAKQIQPKISKGINLEFEYRRPLINKCENCGNIFPNFVRKCPFCNEKLM